MVAQGLAVRVAIVIPCYRVQTCILEVLAAIGAEVERIYVVDDACPGGSGKLVAAECRDPRVEVLFHEHNLGVGGAVITGYRRALRDGMDVVVKLDGDGQMNPALIGSFVEPIACGGADYVKGNRFFFVEDARAMPMVRLIGNAALSFLTKLSSGYWSLFDPTNGYTAIHAAVLRVLPLEKLHQGYFFESDLLFRLGTIRAVVADIPMSARYRGEPSSLRVHAIVLPFMFGHLRNIIKRIFYNYYLRGFSMASVNLLLGVTAMAFGSVFGAVKWLVGAQSGHAATAGTVMLAALPLMLGTQLLLSFLAHDIHSVPCTAIARRLVATDFIPQGREKLPPSRDRQG